MQPVAAQRGEVLCDLHAHPATYHSYDETVGMLSSSGLVGLGQNNKTKRNLVYEQAIRKLEGTIAFDELTPGLLAKVGDGYFCKTQELSPEDTEYPFEILAVGSIGDYLPERESTIDTIKEIHDRDGLAIIVHPYVQRGGLLRYHLLGVREEMALANLCNRSDQGRPDAIEAHNAQLKWHVQKANKLAAEFTDCFDIPGISSSDAHRRLEQVKLCGIGITETIVRSGMGEVKKAIREGDFTRYGTYEEGPYVSAWSFAMGHFYEQKFGGR